MTPRQSQTDRASTVMTFLMYLLGILAVILAVVHASRTSNHMVVVAGVATSVLLMASVVFAEAIHAHLTESCVFDLSAPENSGNTLVMLVLFAIAGGVLFFVVKAPIAVYLLAALSSTCLYHDLSLKYGEGRA